MTTYQPTDRVDLCWLQKKKNHNNIVVMHIGSHLPLHLIFRNPDTHVLPRKCCTACALCTAPCYTYPTSGTCVNFRLSAATMTLPLWVQIADAFDSRRERTPYRFGQWFAPKSYSANECHCHSATAVIKWPQTVLVLFGRADKPLCTQSTPIVFDETFARKILFRSEARFWHIISGHPSSCGERYVYARAPNEIGVLHVLTVYACTTIFYAYASRSDACLCRFYVYVQCIFERER